MNSALASLTETYTDSENEDNAEHIDYSDPEEKQVKAEIVIQLPKKNSKLPRRLVSYNDNEVYEDASDNEQNSSEEVEEAMEPDTSESEDKHAKHVKKYGFTLPPEPKAKPDPKLQETISNIYQKIKISDFDLNQYIQAEKKFRNPSIYDKLIQFLEINELGTNFPPEIYDVRIILIRYNFYWVSLTSFLGVHLRSRIILWGTRQSSKGRDGQAGEAEEGERQDGSDHQGQYKAKIEVGSAGTVVTFLVRHHVIIHLQDHRHLSIWDTQKAKSLKIIVVLLIYTTHEC